MGKRSKNQKPELYISIDIESDGPIPGVNSMLSLGAAAYTKDKKLLDVFSSNLHFLSDATHNPDTMEWWKTQPEAWKKCRENARDPKLVMHEFVDWINSFKDYTPVLVAFPAGFDFTYVYWYTMKFVGKSPVSFSCIDIKTFAMATLNCGYRDSTKRNFPKHWFDKLPHTHVAVDDAIEQGAMFCNILQHSQMIHNTLLSGSDYEIEENYDEYH